MLYDKQAASEQRHAKQSSGSGLSEIDKAMNVVFSGPTPPRKACEDVFLKRRAPAARFVQEGDGAAGDGSESDGGADATFAAIREGAAQPSASLVEGGPPAKAARGGWGRGVRAAAPHETWAADIRGDGLPQIKWDPAVSQLTAHCNLPAHGRLCRLRRTVKPSDRNVAQGRPAGWLLAWLQCAEDFSDQTGHQQAGARVASQRVPAALAHDKRSQARTWLASQPELSAAFERLERASRGTDDWEPEGLP